MRDHNNFPHVHWDDDKVPYQVKNQVLHQEPVILHMPAGFDFTLDAAAFSCRRDPETGVLLDCDGGAVVHHLATLNGLPTLDMVAEACAASNSQVDVDGAKGRLVVHD